MLISTPAYRARNPWQSGATPNAIQAQDGVKVISAKAIARSGGPGNRRLNVNGILRPRCPCPDAQLSFRSFPGGVGMRWALVRLSRVRSPLYPFGTHRVLNARVIRDFPWARMEKRKPAIRYQRGTQVRRRHEMIYNPIRPELNCEGDFNFRWRPRCLSYRVSVKSELILGSKCPHFLYLMCLHFQTVKSYENEHFEVSFSKHYITMTRLCNFRITSIFLLHTLRQMKSKTFHHEFSEFPIWRWNFYCQNLRHSLPLFIKNIAKTCELFHERPQWKLFPSELQPRAKSLVNEKLGEIFSQPRPTQCFIAKNTSFA